MTRYFMVLIMGICCADVYAQSLYDENKFKSLYADQRAWKQGDNVTVIIVENTVATTSADNTSDRGTNMNASIDMLDIDESASANIQSNSSNAGATQRQSRFIAQISATIQKMDNNERFYVNADQEILINGEKQKIHVEGWIRKSDIDSENAILSTRIADAKIEYDGYGDVTKSIKPGLFQRFFQAIGLL